jgi:hypothetical protein
MSALPAGCGLRYNKRTKNRTEGRQHPGGAWRGTLIVLCVFRSWERREHPALHPLGRERQAWMTTLRSATGCGGSAKPSI